MLKAKCFPYTLDFKRPSGTSRGVITTKESWFIVVWDTETPSKRGIGECGILKGLSYDDTPDYPTKIQEVCGKINNYQYWLEEGLKEWPSILFGLETALQDLRSKEEMILFPNEFSNGNTPIPINGLIWMGDKKFMLEQIKEKLQQEFSCIKLKIGAINFEDELNLLKSIRQEFSRDEITLRVDANGAFKFDEALDKLNLLAEFDLHSIEQPIKAGNWEQMASLCEKTPLPIALDEELIGINSLDKKEQLMNCINPQFIILKPSLHGGISGSQDWIHLANQVNADWWITSALESNVGLNAIAQWTYSLNNPLPQGLGTGQLYTNNIPSPLDVRSGHLHYRKEIPWDFSNLEQL